VVILRITCIVMQVLYTFLFSIWDWPYIYMPPLYH